MEQKWELNNEPKWRAGNWNDVTSQSDCCLIWKVQSNRNCKFPCLSFLLFWGFDDDLLGKILWEIDFERKKIKIWRKIKEIEKVLGILRETEENLENWEDC